MIRSKSAHLYLLPGMAGLLVFHIIPLLYGVRFVFSSNSYPRVNIGLQAVSNLVKNPLFWLSLRNIFFFFAACIPTVVVLSFSLACFLKNFGKLGTACGIGFFMPYALPVSATAPISLILLAPNGVAGNALHQLWGVPLSLLTSGALRWVIVMLYLWRNTGFIALVFSAAIQSVPSEYYEHALLEGAGPIRQHARITAPLLAHTFVFAFFIAFMNNMKIYKEIFALSGSYPDEAIYTVQHFINNLFLKMNYNSLSAASYILLFMLAVIFGLAFALDKRISNGGM
ncbi:MAG: sugar ABC transporter permease [Eubacteriales bacterium]|nr:sugar ABC transporter permease [Christensenellaceae bacterium]MEA5065460.1 sugar ABC transporter permease [Eubacteriales bacterium]